MLVDSFAILLIAAVGGYGLTFNLRLTFTETFAHTQTNGDEPSQLYVRFIIDDRACGSGFV